MERNNTVRFGRYLLERRLAMGGMAEVLLGRIEGPQGFQKRVVIKRILPHLQGDENHIQMFLDEARLAARFDHPNLIQVYELARIENQFCLAMEYLEGEDVAAILDESLRLNRKVPLRIAAGIIAAAAEGLHYAHELTTENGEALNVVHRDISPANIIVTWRGGVKIVDFGIAKHTISESHTVAGMLKGKFSYMSPEQARGETVDRRSDIFSLGTIFYELLTVTPCFAGASQMEILDNVIKVRHRPLRDIRTDLPKSVDQVLRRFLTADRRERFPTAEAARQELVQTVLEGEVPTPGEIGRFLEELFDRPAKKTPVRVATAIHDLDEVPVTDELSEPGVIADESSYKLLVESQVTQLKALQAESTDTGLYSFGERSGSFDIPREALKPVFSNRRSTLAKVADRLREPRYWPTTLLVIAAAMLIGGLVLVMIYRAAVGQPWGPTEILSDVTRGAAPEPTQEEEVSAGVLQLLTDPPGATVVVDGVAQEGTSPLTVDNLPIGVLHRITVELAGHAPVTREVTLADAEMQTLRVVLESASATAGEPATVELEVITDPPGAAVSVDGEERTEVTPARLAVEVGVEVEISARLAGYHARAVTVVPAAEQRNTVVVPLIAAKAGDLGRLDLDADPKSDVYLGDRRLGSTPLRQVELPAGSTLVQVRNTKLGLSKTLRLDIAPGETLRRKVVFRKGQVAFDVRPWADVYLGKRKLGTTPMPPVSLYEGTYAFRLVNSELGAERTVQVVVKGGKTRKVLEKLR